MTLGARMRLLLAGGLAMGLALSAGLATADTLPNARLGRGISIHEAMNWPQMVLNPEPTYVWPPFATERYVLPKETLVRLKEVGFDTIRLTVGLGIFLSADEERRRELDAILIDRASRIIEAGLTAIVDFHPVGQDARFPPMAFTRAPGEPLVEAFRVLLVRTATNLSHLPQDRVALEILNEPATSDWSREEATLWRIVQKSYFDSIRTVAPNLTLIVTGCCTCCGLELTMLDTADYPDRNVYFTFHFYAPHGFTHQGVVDPEDPSTRFLKNVHFPIDSEHLVDVEHRARAALSETDPRYRLRVGRDLEQAITRLRQFATPANVEAVFDTTLNWAKRHGVSPQRIFLGEFGVMRPGVRPDSRQVWLETVRSAAERRQMPWAYWSLGGKDFGLRLDPRGQKFDPLILDALGLSRLQSP